MIKRDNTGLSEEYVSGFRELAGLDPVRRTWRNESVVGDNATADEIIGAIQKRLDPDFGAMMLRFKKQHLGPEDGVLVIYNSVPKGTMGVDVDNAFSTPKFSIYAAKGLKWPKDGPAPAKVKIEMFSGGVHKEKSFRGPKVPFRAKTGSAKAVVDYLVDFFMNNKDALLP